MESESERDVWGRRSRKIIAMSRGRYMSVILVHLLISQICFMPKKIKKNKKLLCYARKLAFYSISFTHAHVHVTLISLLTLKEGFWLHWSWFYRLLSLHRFLFVSWFKAFQKKKNQSQQIFHMMCTKREFVVKLINDLSKWEFFFFWLKCVSSKHTKFLSSFSISKENQRQVMKAIVIRID